MPQRKSARYLNYSQCDLTPALSQQPEICAMGGMRPLMIVEAGLSVNAGLGLRTIFPSVQVDTFIPQDPPEAHDE